MLKRFVARLLIIAQVYGCFFQGIAHAATLVDEGGHQRHLFEETPLLGINEPEKLENFEDVHISKFTHLYSEFNEKLGQLQFALGDGLTSPTVFTIPTVNDSDSLEYGGVTVNSQSTYFTFQGLQVSVNKAGIMVVHGRQTEQNPIFLASNRPIVLSNIEANTLSVTSPKIATAGVSRIDYLRFEGQPTDDDSQVSSFVNAGQLTAKELFLNNLTSTNSGRIDAERFAVDGELESTGMITSDELVLEEKAFLKLLDGSRSDIKTLFLSKASHLENLAKTGGLNLDVLDGVGGNITNDGALVIETVAEQSKFEKIVNRNLISVVRGDINTDQLDNSGVLDFAASKVSVGKGTNKASLKANGLEVKTEFTNDETGIAKISAVSGAGELLNQGAIETDSLLELSIRQFTNEKLVKAQALTGLAGLQQFTNAEEASIEVTQALGFDQTTKVINQGFIKAHGLTLVGNQTTQEGEIKVSNLELTGGGEFVNFGDIDVEQGLNLELGSFINKGNLSTKVINGYQNLITLKNDSGSLFKVRDGPLELANTTELINDGTIEAQSLNLHSDQTTIQKSGILKAANISLTGVKPFSNSGQIIASQKLVLDLPSFTNQKTVESSLIDIAKVAELINAKDAVIDTKGGKLSFNQAKVINDGTFNAGDYLFKGGSLAQNGRIEGKSLKIEDIVVTTSDTQTINLSGDLEQSGISSWIMRGKFNARKFFKIGDINLYGTLTLADSFRGAGTIHQGGKLITKNASFYSSVTLDGDLITDTLGFEKSTSKFNLNGNASIKQNAKVGTLKVGKDGVFQRHKGSVLSLSLDEEAEISGIVDVDNLEADKEISLTSTGKLIALKKAQLKADIKIAKGGAANLTGLVMGGTIYNDGEFKAVQGSGTSRLVNRGVAEIEADHSTYGQGKDLKLWLRNEKSGQLTLTRGDFDMRGDNPFENAGILIDNSRWMWLGKPQNSGIWYSPSCSLKRYNGMDMGDFRVDGDLTVESLVDALKALDGLKQTKAKKVILHADKIDNVPTTIVKPVNPKPINKTYPWPLEMRIEGDVNNSFEIFAPELNIYCRNLKTSADIFACESELRLNVKDTIELNARIGSKGMAVIDAKQLKIFGRESIPGASAPNVLYKRNGNGIYSESWLRLNIKELLDNSYGTIWSNNFSISGEQLINLAGLIVGESPYIGSRINVKNIKNVRDEQGSDNLPCTGHDEYWHIRYHRGKCPDRPINIETSDEAIIGSHGSLTFTYDYLEMLVSRIVSGGKLTFKSEGQALVYTDGAVPLNTNMIARNSRVNHIVAKGDVKAYFGSGDVATSLNGANIFVNAAKLTLQSLGIQAEDLKRFFSLSENARRPMPIDEKKELNSSVVMVGKDAEQFNESLIKKKQNQNQTQADLVLEHNVSVLQRALGEGFYTLYRGIDGLGLDREQFFRFMFSGVTEHVRAHKDTKSHTLQITLGDHTQEVEALINPVITLQDLLDSGVFGVLLKFTGNINSLESEKKAMQEMHNANATMHCLLSKSSLKMDGVNTPGKAEITTQDDLDIFTNVRGKNVDLTSTERSVRVGSKVVRQHHGENYTDTLVKTEIVAEEDLNVNAQIDAEFHGAKTHSGVRTKIKAKTGGVFDQAVATETHRVTHSHSKNSSTTTKYTHVHQNVNEHSSDGIVDIEAETVVAQQGTINRNVHINQASAIIQEPAYDQTFVESITVTNKKSGFGGWFGISERKTHNHSSATSTARGCDNGGESFIGKAKQKIKTVAPTFSAKKSDLTAPEIAINVGVNQSQSQNVSIFEGVVWKKCSVSTEKHTTHFNPTFEHNVYLHSPNVVIERVRGSQGTFDKIISDSQPIFKDVDDVHEHDHQSQQQLSAGATLILSLAVTLATANPAAATSIQGAMLSAAYGTLCSQTAICLVENGGNFGKAMDALGERDIGKSMFLSAVSAGLTKGIGDKLGVSGTSFESLAKKHLLQSAINTTLAVTIDNQKPEDAIRQGLTSAAINTLAAYAASKIGDARGENKGIERIDAGTHKLLHGILGATGGALAGAISQQDIARSALAGGAGAVLGETFAELTGNKQLGDLLATVLAFGTGLDAIIAYQAASNATEHNFSAHDFVDAHQVNQVWTEEDVEDGYQYIRDHWNEKVEDWSGAFEKFMDGFDSKEQAFLARHTFEGQVYGGAYMPMGQPSASGYRMAGNFLLDTFKLPQNQALGALDLATMGMGATKLVGRSARFAVGLSKGIPTHSSSLKGILKVKMPSSSTTANKLPEFMTKSQNPKAKIFASKVQDDWNVSAKVREYVKDQFNFREHFAAERLRLEEIASQGTKQSVGKKNVSFADTVSSSAKGKGKASSSTPQNTFVPSSSGVTANTAELDWSIYHSKTTKGDTAHHIRAKHEQLNLRKTDQGVFYGDSVKTVEEAWSKVQIQGIKPSVIGKTDVYVVPRSNAGYAGGIGGQRTNYDYVTIVTKKDSNQIITAYPSGSTPEFPKYYTWLFEGNK